MTDAHGVLQAPDVWRLSEWQASDCKALPRKALALLEAVHYLEVATTKADDVEAQEKTADTKARN